MKQQLRRKHHPVAKVAEAQLMGQPVFDITHTVHWLGGVNNNTFLNVLGELKERSTVAPDLPLSLVVTSPGGPSGIAMSFYDLITRVYRFPLQTVGSGDVDSSGIIIFLTGERRYLTPHTTLLLHLAGRLFDTERRFSTSEVTSILKEDSLKDQQYAEIVAERSGKLCAAQVLDLMSKNTVLSAAEAVELGLAHQIL